jgi:ribosome biogenesis GTPase / thiamine phosphate phosphatase
MDLTKLGWNADLNQQFAPHQAKGLVPARVAVEDKHFFRVWTADAELLAQVTGKCFHAARRSNSNLPKVGDWVAVKLVPSEEKAMIQAMPSDANPRQPRDEGSSEPSSSWARAS